MSKFLKTVSVIALVAAVTVAGVSAAAYFWPAAASGPAAYAGGPGWPGGPGGPGGEAGLEAAAQALGMTVDELTTRLRAGDSLADLATEAGVDVQDVRDAMQAANETAVREAIEQAVTDGDLTRAHADWLLEGLDNGFWGPGAGGPGFGPRGFGGFGGRHNGERLFDPDVVPSATPNSSL